MENHVVKGIVCVMAMIVKMGSFCMYFNVSGPFHIFNCDPGVEEIGTCIAIVLTGMDYKNFISILINEGGRVIKAVFPQIMEKFLFQFSTI
jgi:hypothetical protein